MLYYVLSLFASHSIPTDDMKTLGLNFLMLFVLIFVSRVSVGAYSTVWRYTSTEAYFMLVVFDIVGGCAAFLIARVTGVSVGFWFYTTITALHTLLALFARYCYRLLYKYINRKAGKNEIKKKNICIIGAGQLGVYLANDLNNNPNARYNPICFIDNDRSKVGAKIVGLDVFPREKVEAIVEKYSIEEVVVAISNITGERLQEIRDFYVSHGCTVKLYDTPIHDDDVGVTNKRIIRDFSIDDLLFRDQLAVLSREVTDYYKNKVVLVTGGGGSIGSEIARQIAKCRPKSLVLFDIYENTTYDIQQELVRKYGNTLNLSVEIGSVRDVKRLEQLFDTYRPDVVFHAAAHKHVPLMEKSSSEAIKNNVFGTYNTANMAEKYKVEKFVLVSTDKAVNPTNIMGASKRLCEMVIQCRRDSDTCFSAVRFGNVLGSHGSVIPLFKAQIAAGGPVTITDKNIIRYFMTIPEASQLVMTAGAMAKKGDLFVLDMGKPVKIYDLAENMIRMSGFKPNVDIKIEEIGLRPGEKLFEELLMDTEKLDKTTHSLIFVERDRPETRECIEEKLACLKEAVVEFEEKGDLYAVKRAIKAHVPTFKEPEEVNKTAGKSKEMQEANSVK